MVLAEEFNNLLAPKYACNGLSWKGGGILQIDHRLTRRNRGGRFRDPIIWDDSVLCQLVTDGTVDQVPNGTSDIGTATSLSLNVLSQSL